MEIMLFVATLIALDILALLYGADSRFGVDRDPMRVGMPR
jgi:hypothetical protein